MTVWNSFSPAVVQEIWTQKGKGKTKTIDEIVRVHASQEHRLMRTKKRRANSTVELEPLPQQYHDKKLNTARSQPDIGVQTKQSLKEADDQMSEHVSDYSEDAY